MDYLKRSIKIYEAIPEDERKFPELDQPPGVLLNIGNIYYRNKKYDKADEFFIKTISLYEKLSEEDTKFFGINTAMSNRGLVRQAKGDYTGAEKICMDVYERRKEYNKVEDVLYSLNNIVFLRNHLRINWALYLNCTIFCNDLLFFLHYLKKLFLINLYMNFILKTDLYMSVQVLEL